MASPWIPQNIQKRLLLYILQQLSVFSGIDLPNLEEVSLSNVHLKDIHIDPEKFGKLPGLNLRDGSIRSVELKGGVVGGVMFDVTGVELVFAPNVENFDDQLKQMLELLAQSTADLASTVMLDEQNSDDSVSNMPQSESDSDSEPTSNHSSSRSGSKSGSAAPKTSAFRGVMSRAAELALSRLSVHVSDINIKFISETIDTLLHILKVSFSSNNNSRSVDMTGVLLSVLRPDISNDGSENADPSPSDEDSSNDGNSSEDESLQGSAMFTNEEASSMYMSAISQQLSDKFVPNECGGRSRPSKLFHIDDIHFEFDGLNPIYNLSLDVTKVRVAAKSAAPIASLILSNISKVIKLKTHQLKKQFSTFRPQARRPSRTSENDEVDEDSNSSDDKFPEDVEEFFFRKLHIEELIISLTSILNSEGNFVQLDQDISTILKNTNVRQKNEELVFGGIEQALILSTLMGEKHEIFHFDNALKERKDFQKSEDDLSGEPTSPTEPVKADVRFELFTKSKKAEDSLSEFTILLSKPAELNLDGEVLPCISYCLSSMLDVSEELQSVMKSASLYKQLKEFGNTGRLLERGENNKSSSFVVMQTSSVLMKVNLDQKIALKVFIFPISYNKLQDLMTVQRIIVSIIEDEKENQLLTVPNVSLDTSWRDFKAYRTRLTSENLDLSSFRCPKTISIGKIKGSIKMEELILLKSALLYFQRQYQNACIPSRLWGKSKRDDLKEYSKSSSRSLSSKGLQSSRRPRRSYNGVTFSSPKKLEASWRFHIESIDISVKHVFPKFGDISVDIEDVLIFKQNLRIDGQISSATFWRYAEPKTKEVFFHGLPSHKPMILLRNDIGDRSSSLDITLRKFFVLHRTSWLQLFEKNISEEPRYYEKELGPLKNDARDTLKKWDIRCTFLDFAIGLYPGRLSSGIQVHFEKGNSDFTFSKDQFYVKSTLKNISIFLADDISLLKDPEDSSVSSSTNSRNYLSALGYKSIGVINLMHVGLTFNFNIDDMKKRNEKLGIRGELSLLDLKINSDDHVIELCADSCNTLLQTLNDLKNPIIFRNEDKTKVEVSNNFEFPAEILNEVRGLQEGKETTPKTYGSQRSEMDSDQKDEDFLVLDEQYLETDDKNIDSVLSKLSIDDASNSASEASQITITEEHFNDKRKRLLKVHLLSLNVNLSKAKIFLHDGYDWKETRKSLRKAVKNMECKANSIQEERNSQSMEYDGSHAAEVTEDAPTHDEEFVTNSQNPSLESNHPAKVHETLYESIHLLMDPEDSTKELVHNINEQIQSEPCDEKPQDTRSDLNVNVQKLYKNLRLNRSKAHKIMVELTNVEVNVFNHTNRDPRFADTPNDLKKEMVNQIDLRVDTIDVHDNIATSSWKKMLTYMNILGEREIGTSMVQLGIINIRPDPTLLYTEAVLSCKILPVRLHIDQDTLAFLTRFLEFKDHRFDLPADEPLFIQKLRIDPIRVKFDYKPKRIDFSGIRAGQNTNLVNLFTLDGADVTLGQAVLYGILGFPKLGQALGKVYGGFIQRYQLAGILTGLNGVRSVVNLGSGMRDLITVPISEYRKDGQLLRSLLKGTKLFGKTTSNELIKLGIKLASGTQVLLERSEEYFGGEGIEARQPRQRPSKSNSKSSKDSLPFEVQKERRKRNLLETSQVLSKSVNEERDPYMGQKLYSVSSVDDFDEEEEYENGDIEPSVLLVDEESNEDDEIVDMDEETLEKVVSLYSNQPTNSRQGLEFAIKSLGRNLKSTKKSLVKLRSALQEADSLQEQVSTIVRSTPVVVIRPMIGTTEAVMKTLMGVSNEIDSKGLVEARAKYGDDKPHTPR